MTRRHWFLLHRPSGLTRLASSFLVGGLLLPVTLPTLAMAATPAAAATPASASVDLTLPARQPNATTIIKSPNDPSEYRTLTLANGLQVLLVHDQRADKASAAMDVGIGSADEPADVPGLAHFLEHMLFISNQRYPKPGEFMEFISANSGQTNAYTASDHTNFIFSIPPNQFEQALDRFAQFFVAPQFNADYVDRERHAVNSEYQMQLQNDVFRLDDVLSTVTNTQHPFHRFSVGSLDTLKDGPGGKLRDRLVAFHASHYSARNMKLVVMGPQSFEQLEQWVRAAFKDVPDVKVSAPKIEADLVRPDQLPLAVTARSQQQTPEIQFIFQLPSDRVNVETQPTRYLGKMLGDESTGSLLSRLRAQGWASELSAGSLDTDRRQDLYSIAITLTPAGQAHIEDIQASLFAYLSAIRQDIEPWRFEEQSLLARQQFRFLQTDTSFERASALSTQMQLMPISEVNVAPYRLERFDAALIHRVLDQMAPQRLLRLYTAPDVNGDKTTENFKVPYTATPITQWPTGTALAGLSAPARNSFIAQDLNVLPLTTAKPRQLIQQTGMDLWYAPDSTFGTPSVEWRLNLLNPISAHSARELMLNALMVGWLRSELSETLYPALEAGQSASATAYSHGVTLSLAGWRDGQPHVIAAILDQLQHGDIKAGSFARAKQQIGDGLRDEEHSALFQQLAIQSTRRLVSPHWDSATMLEALQGLTPQDLDNYRRDWLKDLHVQGLVTGNLDEATALQTAEVLNQRLAPKRPFSDELMPHTLVIKPGLATFRPQTDQQDSALFRYTQGPSDSPEATARYMVLGQIMSQPFFTQLRTQEQLGYVVAAGQRNIMQVPGLFYLIQSPHRDSKALAARVNAWEKQFDGTLQKLDEATLKRYKDALIDTLKERDNSLNEKASRLWQQLLFNWTAFDRREVMIKAVDNVTLKDIKATWRAFRKAPHFEGVADKGVPATQQDITAGLKPFVLQGH